MFAPRVKSGIFCHGVDGGEALGDAARGVDGAVPVLGTGFARTPSALPPRAVAALGLGAGPPRACSAAVFRWCASHRTRTEHAGAGAEARVWSASLPRARTARTAPRRDPRRDPCGPRPGITDLSTGRPHTKVMLHLSIQKSIPLAPFRNGSYRVSHISFSSAYFMFSYRSGDNPVRPPPAWTAAHGEGSGGARFCRGAQARASSYAASRGRFRCRVSIGFLRCRVAHAG